MSQAEDTTMLNYGFDPLPLTEVLAPAGQANVASIIARAAQTGVPVYPIGGGTSLDYGVRPAAPGLGLSLTALNRLIDYPARDLTITVEAGMTVAALAKHLAAEGQRLPVNVPQPDQATVGGVVVSWLPGPRQYRSGGIRDSVIGFRAIDGCGTAFSAGGRVVKNAAGYDLCRLLCGSLGTLGVIVEVTLMVKPMPETSALVASSVADWDAAERLLAGLVKTRTLPAAIELVTGPVWENDSGLGLRPQNENPVARLIVGFEGTAAEVEWMTGQLREEWKAAGADGVTLLGDGAWPSLTHFPVSRPSDDRALVLQINVLPSNVVESLRQVLALDPRASVLAHAGSGVIYARLAMEPGDAAAVIRDRLRPEISAGGAAVVLAQPADASLDAATCWGAPRPAQAILQSIKTQFDPKNVLNRGRYIFPA